MFIKDSDIINNLDLSSNINNFKSSKIKFLCTNKFTSTCNNYIKEVESFCKKD